MKKLYQIWEAHFLGLEVSAAFVLALVFGVWLGLWDGAFDQIDCLLEGNRQNFYGRISTIAGTLMGFGFAVGSFIIPATLSSERFRLLRGSPYYQQLWKTYTQTVKCFGLLTVNALVCLVLDTDTSPWPWGLVPFSFFLLLASFRLFRSLWLLELIFGVVSRPKSNEQQGAPPL